jgi:hypothetical protein
MWKSRDLQQHTENEIETRGYSEKLDKEDGGSEGRSSEMQNDRTVQI